MLKDSNIDHIWFARVCAILGIKELTDAANYGFHYIKIKSGLPIVYASSNDDLTPILLVLSLITGVYLLSGASAFCKVAFNKYVSRSELNEDIPLPKGHGWLSIAIASFGACFAVYSFGQISLAAYHKVVSPSMLTPTSANYSYSEFAFGLQFAVTAFVLLSCSTKISRFIFPNRTVPVAPHDEIGSDKQ